MTLRVYSLLPEGWRRSHTDLILAIQPLWQRPSESKQMHGQQTQKARQVRCEPPSELADGMQQQVL